MCYFVLSVKFEVVAKELMLVCGSNDIVLVAVFFSVFRAVGLETPEYRPDTPNCAVWSLRVYTRSIRVFAAKHNISCVNILSYASHLFLHTLAHSTIEPIRLSVVLLINMPIVDV